MIRLIPLMPLLLAALALLPGCTEQRDQLRQALHGKPPVIAGTLAGDWRLIDLNGGGAPMPQIMLRFGGAGDGGVQGQLAGSGGCNRFNGPWNRDGQMIELGPFAATQMACAPPVMEVEQRLLALLDDASALQFTADGDAVLTTRDGRRVQLRRPATD